MGEYAEMMLDGTCCSSCGEYIGGGDGFPVMCSACAPSPGITLISENTERKNKPFRCSHSGCKRKFVNENDLKNHLRMAHIDKVALQQKQEKDKRLNIMRNAAPQLLEALENLSSAYGMLCHQIDESPESNKYYMAAIAAIAAARGEA